MKLAFPNDFRDKETCTASTFLNVNSQIGETFLSLFFLVVFIDASCIANCAQLSCGVKDLIQLRPPHCFGPQLRSLLFFTVWQSPSCLDFKEFMGRFFLFLLPVVYMRNHETAGFGKGEATTQRCSGLKSEALRVFGIIFSFGCSPEGLEVSLGSVSRCRFVEDCGRARKLSSVLLSNLFNAFMIALHFIMSCTKPWSGSAVKRLWYSFSRTKYFIARRWVFVLWEAINIYV